MKRKLLLMLMATFLIPWIGNAQVQIGTGTTTGQGLPIEPFYGFSYSQVIYLASEVNASGTITQLEWYFDGTSLSNSNDWTIYIGHTSKTSFSSTSDWIPVSSMTQVYSGTFPDPGAAGWITFDITDWAYNGTDNIVVAVDENASGYDGSSDDFFCTSVAENRGIMYRNDNTNPDPASPPTASYLRSYIANIIFDGIAQSCPSPISLTVSNATTTTAELAWTQISGSTGYNWEVVASGGTPGTGTAVSSGSTTAGNDTTATATGLTSKTTYDAYVQNDCGSSWTGPTTFTTSGTCGVWHVDLIDSYGDGWNGGVLDVYVNGTLYYDDLTLSSGSGPESHGIPTDIGDILSFDYTAGNYSTENEYKVYDEGGNMVADEGTGGTTPGDIGDPAVPSGLTSCAACPDPTAQTETNFTTTGADLGWTDASGSHWDIYVVPTGDPAPKQSTTPTANDVTANPYTWTGGTAATTYDWYVRSDCDQDNTGTSAWVGPSTFSTQCEVQTTLNESFETGSFPICWSQETNDDFDWTVHSGSTASSNTGPSSAYDGTYYLYTESSSPVTNGDSAIVYTGSIDLTGFTSPRLNFWYHMYGAGMDPDGTIEVSISNDNGVSYVSIWSKSGNQGNQWYQALAYLSSYSADTVIFKVKAVVSSSGTSYENDFAIDLFQVDEAPTCPAPTSQVEDSLKLNSAQLSWTENGSATEWNIRIGTSGFDTTGTSYSVVTNDTITVDTLLASTTYDWYVRASCGGGDYSDWIGPHSFTTTNGKATGPYPADGTDPVLVSSDTLKWNPVDNATKYLLNIGTTSGGSDILANYSIADTIYIAGNPWDYNTQYFWTVNTVYNGTNDTVSGTEWDFTTECGVYTPEYTQGFAAYIPICWTETTGYLNNPSVLTGTSSAWIQDDFANVVANGKSAKLDLYGTTKKDWLISPSIDLSGDAYQLEFDLALTQYGNTNADTLGPDDTLAVVISTDNGATWNLNDTLEVWTYPEIISNTGEHVTIDLTAYSSTVKIGFYGSSSITNKDNDVFIDNFKVRVPPACPEPLSLTEDSIKLNSVKMHWKESGSATTWNVRIGETGFDTTGAAYYTVTADTFLTVDTLLASTAYEWYVRASCGSGSNSVWVKSPTPFTTSSGLTTGPYPADGSQKVLVTSDTLAWNPVDNATKYLLNIGTTSGGSDVLANYSLTDTLYKRGSNWDYSTQYFWTVSTVYNGTSDTVAGTEWSFSTECDATSVPYFQNFDAITAPDFPFCMTVENTNGDAYTWETSTDGLSAPNAAKIRYNSNEAMDDWFFTRGLNLTAGVTYEVSFAYRAASSSFPEKLAVDWGNLPASTAMSGTSIFDNSNVSNTSWFIGTGTFTPTTTETYYIGFHGYSDADQFNLYVDDIKVVEVVATATWTGASGSDWDTTGNWNPGLPSSTSVVTIPTGLTNYPTVNSATTIDSLVIESDASGDASILNDGLLIVSGHATVQRYTTAGVWHDFSSPVQGQTLNNLYLGGSPDVWITHYNEPDNSRTYMTTLTDPLDVGAGYELWVGGSAAQTFNFTGTLNRADVALTTASTPALSFTGADPLGYNLIGNPFASPIALDSGAWNMANVDSTFWVWSNTLYKDYNTTTKTGALTGGIIPMGQGFFIHANAASPTFTIPLAARVHSSQAYYKSTRINDLDMMKLRAMFDNDNYDELNILFIDGASELFENRDTRKMFSFSGEAPQVYAIIPDEELSQNSLPALNPGDERTVTVGYKAGVDGTQTLVADLSSLPETDVVLEDLKLNKVQNLNNNPVYTFEATTYQDPDRFRLHFNRSVTGIDNNNAHSAIRAYSYEKNVYVLSNKELANEKKVLTVYDITGRTLVNKILPPGDIVRVPVNASNTYVVVKVISNGEVYTTKVFIK